MREFLNSFFAWMAADYNRVIAFVAVLGGVIGAIFSPFLRFPLQLRAVRSQEKLDGFKAAVAGLEALLAQKDTELETLREIQRSHDQDRDHWYRTREMLSRRIEELQARSHPWPDTPSDSAIIIVVEDDAAAGRTILRILERLQMEGFITTKGYDALRHLRSGQFRLMILDFGLPDINGIDVAILARRAGYSLPIIGLTGVAGDLPIDTPRMKEAAFSRVMAKTSRADEIMDAIRSVLPPLAGSTGDCG